MKPASKTYSRTCLKDKQHAKHRKIPNEGYLHSARC